jgi:hypothetical protein
MEKKNPYGSRTLHVAWKRKTPTAVEPIHISMEKKSPYGSRTLRVARKTPSCTETPYTYKQKKS